MNSGNRYRSAVFCGLFAITLLSIPAFAQIDISGEWIQRFYEDQPERGPGPSVGDYLGLPINDDARMKADTWTASSFTLPEWQCRPHPPDDLTRGPQSISISKDIDPATRQLRAYYLIWPQPPGPRVVWMDGTPHPPEYAEHTWMGFSTGKWDGDVLTVTTTHLKEAWIRRNGVPRSDQGRLIEHFIRHGDILTVVTIVYDPIYLTEPFVRTTDFELNLQQFAPRPFPCEVTEEIDRPKGAVPHWLPGTNPDLSEFANMHELPEEAARGGANTMYPEYQKILRETKREKD